MHAAPSRAKLRARRALGLVDYPVCLQLAGRKVVVVGAGRVATPRIRSLVAARAAVTVVALSPSPAVRRLAARGALALHVRGFCGRDLDGAFVAFAATDDRAKNRFVAVAARARGVLVNAADDPALCDFTMPAVARHRRLTLAVSTAGTRPGLAKRLRDELLPALRQRREEPS